MATKRGPDARQGVERVFVNDSCRSAHGSSLGEARRHRQQQAHGQRRCVDRRLVGCRHTAGTYVATGSSRIEDPCVRDNSSAAAAVKLFVIEAMRNTGVEPLAPQLTLSIDRRAGQPPQWMTRPVCARSRRRIPGLARLTTNDCGDLAISPRAAAATHSCLISIVQVARSCPTAPAERSISASIDRVD
jgi:hypothetical protein